MTIIVTRDVAARFRGFLASCMLEIAPGVYASPNMNTAVRERVWNVMQEWYDSLGGGSIVLTWSDSSAVAGQTVRTLGLPPVDLIDFDGVVLARRH